MQGNDAKAALAAEAAKVAQAADGKYATYRYWMKKDEEKLITFLDGQLDEDGMLDIPLFFEHSVQSDGRWKTYVCIGEDEGCPFCAEGNRKSLCGVLTIIDHSEFTGKSRDGQPGKLYKNEKVLFVCKKGTIQALTAQAREACDGDLTGATFKVTRSSDPKSPRVGDSFFLKKKVTSDQLETLGEGKSLAYEYTPEEIGYKDKAQLAELGFGDLSGFTGATETATVSGGGESVDEIFN